MSVGSSVEGSRVRFVWGDPAAAPSVGGLQVYCGGPAAGLPARASARAAV